MSFSTAIVCHFQLKYTYQVDLTKEVELITEKFDIVVHTAGLAHSNDIDSKSFFEINFEGTKRLCNSLDENPPKNFVFISSVAVYGLNSGENITEDYPLLGSIPYAQSKIEAEVYLTGWCKENDIVLTILRPSLIAGPNPPGNLGAMVNGIKNGKYKSIGEGKAHKSVLMVQDIANLIPLVVDKGGIFNVCDSMHPTFRELESLISSQLGKSLPISIPLKLAKFIASLGDLIGNKSPINTNKLEKITKSLTFSNEKAKRELGWEPINVLDEFRIY